MNWITEGIANFMSDLTYGILDFIGDYINNIFVLIVQLNDTKIISSATTYTVTLSIILVGIMAIKDGINIYVLQTEGNAEDEPLDILTRTGKAIAFITCNGWVFSTMLNLSKLVVGDVVGSVSGVDIKSNTSDILTVIFRDLTTNGVIWTILIFIMIICIIIFSIMAGVRGAELMLFKILFPFFCIDLVKSTPERFNNFFASYIVTMFGYVIQLLAFKIFTVMYASASFGEVQNIIACLGWLIVMIRAPKWLEKFIYTSGVGNVLKGAGRTGMFMLPYLSK